MISLGYSHIYIIIIVLIKGVDIFRDKMINTNQHDFHISYSFDILF